MNQLPTADTPAVYERVRAYTENRKQRVFIMTFGCQQNEADSEKLLGMALEMGYSQTDDPAEASLILVNTCAIREHAEQKALSKIGSFKKHKKEHPDCILGVVGCMTAQAHRTEQLKRCYPYVDFTLTPSRIHLLPSAVLAVLEGGRRYFLPDSGDPLECPDVRELPVVHKESFRAWVSIMYGCNNFCSYCIVPYVRLRERSRSAHEIENEVRTLVENGCHDITLLGQNVNSYHGDCRFPELLERLDRIEGDFLLRFMTSHPKDADPDLIRVMREGKHIAPHLHLPLQSGSDRILAKMNRHYDLNRYMDTVTRFRADLPDAALTTDIIVGFPGETEEDFEATLAVLKRVEYDMVYAFLYSPRKGTPAAEMQEQIDEKVKHERFDRLLALQDEISAKKAKAYEKCTLRVLADGQKAGSANTLTGRTDTNKLVHFKGDASLIGSFINVRIDRAEAFVLYGTIV
ncbi:MAG: tRNA (N6-isopentenyl adenosine(37)-C2)-methylthiotransferase MiaB [Clostridia bacterium]|nr:tRNA (N6-isopentenyl adenosine(37)-C2)-methylthiotransferase MiaB [Clostridia bacterium]